MMQNLRRPKSFRRHSEAGFTLVEVLITMVVVAVAVPSIMMAFSSQKGSPVAEYAIRGADLGQMQMEAISAKSFADFPAAGTYTCATFQTSLPEISCSVPGLPAYSFSWEVVDVGAADPDVAGTPVFAKKIILTVSRAGMNTIQYYTLFAS